MKKKSAFFFVSLAAALVVAGLMPGCDATQCDTLEARCNTECADTDYEISCKNTVQLRNETLCAEALPSYQAFCSGKGSGGGGAGGASASSCSQGQTLCEGHCVNLQQDPKYCGSCVVSCGGDTPFCSSGMCVNDCAPPKQKCPPGADTGSCVDVNSDPNHCGACGTVCPEDKPKCQPGGMGGMGGAPMVDCVAACAAGRTDCNNSCVDVQTDALHCGACGNACLPSQACAAGSCQTTCADNQSVCGGKCVNTNADPSHCGGCNVVCAAPQVCSNGSCKDMCDPPLTQAMGTNCIDRACVDTSNDPSACGSNCDQCGANAQCVSKGADFKCGCSDTSKKLCAPLGCVDVQSDPAHCGGCDKACVAGAICSGGNCACPNGLSLCADGCFDLQTSPQHCGGCDKPACSGTNAVCDKGTCKASCPPGTSNCDGACVDLNSDLNHCGSCTSNCDDNSVCTVDTCVSGKCNSVSGGGLCDDGNPCTKNKCDPQAGCKTEPYPIAEWVALCAQVAGVTADAAKDECVVCNPQADNNQQACVANKPAMADGVACTVPTCQLEAPGGMALLSAETPDDSKCPGGQTCMKGAGGAGGGAALFSCQ